jgi:hypothetical protein
LEEAGDALRAHYLRRELGPGRWTSGQHRAHLADRRTAPDMHASRRASLRYSRDQAVHGHTTTVQLLELTAGLRVGLQPNQGWN